MPAAKRNGGKTKTKGKLLMPFRWNQKTRACHALGAALAVASASLCAQTAINMQAQPLSTALSQLARERGVNILALDNLVAGRAAPAVSGVMTVPQALDRLLQGSGLTAQQQDEKTYVIRALPPARKEPASGAGASVLPTITVTDSSAPSDSGFVAVATSTATRTDTPIAEIPQSVQVVTEDVLKSQQVQSVGDALRNVSGVSISNAGADSIGGTPYIRGMTAAVSVNGGISLARADTALSLPAIALSSVEVLKGASAILAGASDPGGIVNINVKRPQAEPVREATLQTGSYGNLMGGLDLAGAFSEDKKLIYRFVVSGERNSRDFIGHDGKRDFYVAPSIGWRSGGTDLAVGFEQHTGRQPPPSYTFPLLSGPAPLTGLSGRADDHMSVNSTSAYYDLKQQLTPGLTLQSKARYIADSSINSAYTAFPADMGTSDPLAVYTGVASRTSVRSFNLDNSLKARFATGPVRHTMLAGFAYTTAWTSVNGGYGGMAFGAFPMSDLPPLSQVVTPQPSFTYSERTYQNVFYLQDQLKWDRLTVLASINHGQAWSSLQPSVDAWSPGIGFVYQLTDVVGIYANALRSFSPQSNIRRDLGRAEPMPPQTGRSVEAGVKLNLLDDRLTGTLAVYRAAKYNVAMSDPTNPGFSFLVPGVVSRGFEMDLTGRLMPGWNIIASYTYANQLPTEGNISQLPRSSASLWTTYDLQGETLRGWGVGVGIWARTRYQATAFTGENRSIPGQARTDASLYYRDRQWSLTLGVKNLFARALYGDYASQQLVEVLPGRLVYVTATHNF
ncbi:MULTISPECIES: TonB-dependent siderophore receptor [Cupriavidus]